MYDTPIPVDRSLSLRFLNRAGAIAERCGIRLFDPDPGRVLAEAAAATGFDYADDAMSEGLGELLRSIRADARPNAFGKIALRNLLKRNAESRFRIEQNLAASPEIAEERIDRPVFIVGMPRSGTTILQALLHLDAAHRSPLCWECLLPHPAPTPADYQANERLDAIRKEFARLFALVPDFRRKHYMEADSPQECIAVTALNFTSFQFIAQCYLPGYHEWFVGAADQVGNFRWHRRFLQHLQSGGLRPERWLLKSPVHLMRLKALFEVYPDARIVMTHRDPSALVPSTASLISSMRSLYSDHEDTARTGREQLHVWADYFDRCPRGPGCTGKEDQIVDVRFDDFAEDQMGVVDRLYARFGWELDAASRARMERFLVDERRGRHGEHEYSLAQIGLTESDIRRHYGDYLDFLRDLEGRAVRTGTG